MFRVDTINGCTVMNVDVYDIYVDEKAADMARAWSRSIDMNPNGIKLEQCRYCHSEAVNFEVSNQLEPQGFSILPMECCPALTFTPKPLSVRRFP